MIDKLFLVDAVNILFRSYFAIRPMTNPQGESTNALFGFIRSIQKIRADFSPLYFAAIFDGEENKRSRKELYQDYKAHRKELPGDLLPQLARSLQFCEVAGIPHLAVPGVEADDTIASITRWAEKQGTEVFIISSDKDLCQLVNDHVKLIHPHKDNLVVDRLKVKELFGVHPEQIVDYLALVGDTSDNIPGVEGIGEKTAALLLQECGSLEEILAHPEKAPGKKRQETLAASTEVARLSYKLATLHLDVEFPQREEFFRLKEPEIEELKELYTEMNFLTLLKDLDGGASPSKEKVSYQCVTSLEEMERALEQLKKSKEICIDTETTSTQPMLARLVGVGLGSKPKEAFYIPLNGDIPKTAVIHALLQFCENPHLSFFGHNIKYDLHVLANVGIELKQLAFDTMLASYLLNPHVPRHGLDAVTLERLSVVKTPIEALIGKKKPQLSMEDVPVDKVSDYCCEDVDYTIRLKELFEKELKEKKLTTLLLKIELPLIPILAEMERRGIYIDVKILEQMKGEMDKEIRRLEKAIFNLANCEFNLNSPKQLSRVLFEDLKIRAPRRTTTGFSTAADVLEELSDEHPIIRQILEYRVLEKLNSTYVTSLPGLVGETSQRIHCTYNQFVTATGRLSSQDPNLQNIPVRSPLGRKIRSAFRPEDPDWSFLSADYSQIELRLLAHLSEDPLLLKAFRSGEDIHTFTASLVYDIPLTSVTEEMRQKAKAVNFGIIYGQEAYGLSQTIDIPFAEAREFIDAYFLRYKKVKEYVEFCKGCARRTGHAITLTGRLRPIPEIHSKNAQLRAQAERFAMNTPLQGSAADLIKEAMIDIDALLKAHPSWNAHMLLQIHDELVFEAPDSHLSVLSKGVKERMEGVWKLKVPLVVEISIGKNWGEC